MLLNIDKSSILAFNAKQPSPEADYTLNDDPSKLYKKLNILGVILQSDVIFNTHIRNKVSQAKRQLGMVKRAVYDALKNARLLAYTSLCRPHIDYRICCIGMGHVIRIPNALLKWFSIEAYDSYFK